VITFGWQKHFSFGEENIVQQVCNYAGGCETADLSMQRGKKFGCEACTCKGIWEHAPWENVGI